MRTSLRVLNANAKLWKCQQPLPSKQSQEAILSLEISYMYNDAQYTSFHFKQGLLRKRVSTRTDSSCLPAGNRVFLIVSNQPVNGTVAAQRYILLEGQPLALDAGSPDLCGFISVSKILAGSSTGDLTADKLNTS
jgi:hypothetical protein